MKKFICLLLCLVLLVSLVACTKEEKNEETEPANPIKELSYFSMSYSADGNAIDYINITPNGETCMVDFTIDGVKKTGELSASVVSELSVVLAGTKLPGLADTSEYADGMAFASAYIEYADGTFLTCDFSGEIHEDFTGAFTEIAIFVTDAAESLAVYVPELSVMGEVDPALLDEIKLVMEGSGVDPLDAYAVAPCEKGEFFADEIGMISDAGVAVAACCRAQNMSTAYSFSIVKLDGSQLVENVCDSFVQGMNWDKWVCVRASDAVIATKGDMVLCIMADGDVFQMMLTGLEAGGWDVWQSYTDPAVG
ncbi:MAG: hypothetical protein E7467_06800 [Ruminococcaceae bacterium]|nr:hypothetical protein [Oscillospiraceae bacterium]